MANWQPASHQTTHGHDMHDVNYLRARASQLREAAATSRDPEVARALREVAGDFDNEAKREEAGNPNGGADERRRCAGGGTI